MIKKLSIIIVIIGLTLYSFLMGEHFGFEKGIAARISESSLFSGNHESLYTVLGRYYFYIILLLIVFLIGKQIKKELFSQIISISSLIFIFFIHWKIYIEKEYLIEINTLNFSKTVAFQTKQFDLLGISIIVLLLIIQITILVIYYFGKRQKIAD